MTLLALAFHYILNVFAGWQIIDVIGEKGLYFITGGSRYSDSRYG